MLDKINYIFDKKQKANLVILCIIIFGGGICELLGVSAVLPLINLALNPAIIEESKTLLRIKEIFDIADYRGFIILLSFLIILIYIIKNGYLIIMYKLQFRFVYNNQKRLALRLMETYLKQDYVYHLKNNSSDLLRNIQGDVTQFFTVVLQTLQLVAEVITCSLLIIFLMLQDYITTFFLGLILFLFLLIFFGIFRKLTVKLGVKNRKLQGDMNRWLLQAFAGMKETKVFNKENFFVEMYKRSYENYIKIAKKQNLLGAIPKPIIESLCICGILLIMALRVYFGNDMETFIPTLAVFAIASFRMLPAFNRIVGFLNGIMFGKASVEAVYSDLVEAEKLKVAKNELHDNTMEFKNVIQIENVSYKYPDTDKFVLEDISMKIEKNSSIALIGPSGAGKTTLADLILGLLKPNKGSIKVDDFDIENSLYNWHELLGYIPQSIYLLDDTIANNIAYGVEIVDEKLIRKVLAEAQLDEFIMTLPDGIYTQVGERGVRLSGGQKQRIGIARALYRNPQILILDEATSALDNGTEEDIMKAINHLKGKRTMIIIAHRLSTIKNCDEIFEVKDKKIMQKDKKDILI